jgi:hypothetical protein
MIPGSFLKAATDEDRRILQNYLSRSVTVSQPFRAPTQIKFVSLLFGKTEMDIFKRLEYCLIAAVVLVGLIVGIHSLVPA